MLQQHQEEVEIVRYSGTRVCLKLLQMLERATEHHTHILTCLQQRRRKRPQEDEQTQVTMTTTPTVCVDLCVDIVQALVHLFPSSSSSSSSSSSKSNGLSPHSHSHSSSTNLSSPTSWIHTPTALVTHVVWVATMLLRPSIPRLYRVGIRAVAAYLKHFDVTSEIHADVLLSTQPLSLVHFKKRMKDNTKIGKSSTDNTTTTTTSSSITTSSSCTSEDSRTGTPTSNEENDNESPGHRTFPGLLRLSSYGIGRPSTSNDARFIACQCLLAVPSLNDVIHPLMYSSRQKLIYVLCNVAPWLSLSVLKPEMEHQMEDEMERGTLLDLLDDLGSACHSSHCPSIAHLLTERRALYEEEMHHYRRCQTIQRHRQHLLQQESRGCSNFGRAFVDDSNDDFNGNLNDNLNGASGRHCNLPIALQQKLVLWSKRLSIDIVSTLMASLFDDVSDSTSGINDLVTFFVHCVEAICGNVVDFSVGSNAEKSVNAGKSSNAEKPIDCYNMSKKMMNRMHIWCCGLELLNQILTSLDNNDTVSLMISLSNPVQQKSLNAVVTSVLRFVKRTQVVAPSLENQRMQDGRRHAWNIVKILNSNKK